MNKISKLDIFLKRFPIVMSIILLGIFITIYCCSDGIKPAKLSYQNIETFTKIYKAPLQLFLVSLTIWGILIAYQTYLQTKEIFIKQNRPWVTVYNIKLFKETKDDFILEIVFYNFGNIPALKLQPNIKLTINNIQIFIKDLLETDIAIYPKADLLQYIIINKNKFNIDKDNYPTIKFQSDIIYYGIDHEPKHTKGTYEYNLSTKKVTNLGEICS